MNNNVLEKLLIICIILLMLDSINAWFLWSLPIYLLDFFTAIIALLYLGSKKNHKKLTNEDLMIYLLFFLASLWQRWEGLEILSCFHPSFLFLLLLPPDKYIKLIKVWTTTLACILGVSLVAWFIIINNPSTSLLPNMGVITRWNQDMYSFYNYGLCLFRVHYSFRFNSIFLEPGHVSMYAVFTMAVNRFNFKKWQTIILFISVFFTFSLAGYILFVFGSLLYNLSKRHSLKRVFVRIVLLCSMVAGGYFFALKYNGGDNLVNSLIVERLKHDEEIVIVGNNRVSESTNKEFDRILDSADLLTGLPEAEFKRKMVSEVLQGAGYKMFLLQKGIVGLIFFLLTYYLLYKKYRDKRFGLTMLLLYIFAFLQRATPLLETWIYLFLFASVVKMKNGDNAVKAIPY